LNGNYRATRLARAFADQDFCSDFYGVYTGHDEWLHGYRRAHTIREAKKIAEVTPCAVTEEFRDRLVAFYAAGKAAAQSGDASARKGARIRLGHLISSTNFIDFPDIVRLQELTSAGCP
jgi:hypothetical protein